MRGAGKTVELILALAKEAPAPVRYVNLGGGFGIPYFDKDAPLDLAAIGANLAELVDNRVMPNLPEAEVVIAFVNTRADGAGRKELFGGAEALAAWLAEHHRAVASGTVTDADAATARELRDALVAVMLAHSGDVDPAGEDVRAAEAHLSRAGMLYPLVPLITEQGVRLVSPQDGVAHAFGSVLAAVTEFAQSGEWRRLKACRNPPCHFGFFDRTRNGSGLYCSTGCSA